MAALDEFSIIKRYFRPLAGEGAFGLLDDAARFDPPPDCDLVVTTDMVVSRIHFLPGDPPDTVAQKALRVNISDLAAKGAEPLAYVLTIGISPEVDADWLARFAQGLRADQDRFGIRLLGGDTVFAPEGPLVSITTFGAAPRGRMVHRHTGRPGDLLFVSGTIGMATLGLAILKDEKGPWESLGAEARDTLVQRYRVPEPRTALAGALVECASAAMDISDGLVGDCDKLAAGAGCSAVIEADRVSVPLPVGSDDDALFGRLLSGGDDYEILAAVPPEKASEFSRLAAEADVPVARVGVLREGQEPTEVVHSGRSLKLPKRAYVHGQT